MMNFCKSQYIGALFTSIVFTTQIGFLQCIRCTKDFSSDGVNIVCMKHPWIKDSEAKLTLQYSKNDKPIASPVNCTKSTDANVTACQQLIPFKNLGMGQYEIFATIYSIYKRNGFENESTAIEISLDSPKIALENCSYAGNERITAFCTCRRVDFCEIETWITLYLNDTAEVKTKEKQLKYEVLLNESSEIKCEAENIIGWKSIIANAKYKLRERDRKNKEIIFRTSFYASIGCLIAVALCSILYVRYRRNEEKKLFTGCGIFLRRFIQSLTGQNEKEQLANIIIMLRKIEKENQMKSERFDAGLKTHLSESAEIFKMLPSKIAQLEKDRQIQDENVNTTLININCQQKILSGGLQEKISESANILTTLSSKIEQLEKASRIQGENVNIVLETMYYQQEIFREMLQDNISESANILKTLTSKIELIENMIGKKRTYEPRSQDSGIQDSGRRESRLRKSRHRDSGIAYDREDP